VRRCFNHHWSPPPIAFDMPSLLRKSRPKHKSSASAASVASATNVPNDTDNGILVLLSSDYITSFRASPESLYIFYLMLEQRETIRLFRQRIEQYCTNSGCATASAYPYATSNQTSNPKLAPSSSVAMNSVRYNSASYDPTHSHTIPSTIRTVPSFDASSDTSSSEPPSARNSAFSSSVNSSVSGASYSSRPQQPSSPSNSRLKPESSNPALTTSYNAGSQMSSSNATPRGKEN
jgi:hypothetical protein